MELTGVRPGAGVSSPVGGPRWAVESGGFGRVVAMVVMVLAPGALAVVSEMT